MTLDEMLALLPDNDSGAIDADDLRAIVTELWTYTNNVQATQHDLVVDAVPLLQAEAADADRRLDALETSIFAGGLTADGTMVNGPAGWSSTMVEPGLYTVTHDLGTLDYAVVVTPLAKSIDGMSPAVEATSETAFTFGTYSAVHAGLHGVYTNFVVVVRRG